MRQWRRWVAATDRRRNKHQQTGVIIMSTTLFFLIPIGMLAVVWSLCFVGCVLPVSGLPDPYSNQILSTTGLLAYWPLSDFPGGVLPAGAPPLPPTPQGSQSIGPAA